MIRFSNTHKKFILLNCFSAMRIHKESQKHMIMGETLTQDHDVAISAAEAVIARKTAEAATKSKKIGSKVITAMLSKMIFTYFAHWKEVSDMYKAAVRGKIKDRLIKTYNNYITSYFVSWKNQKEKKKRHGKKKMVMQMESQGEDLQKELDLVQAKNDATAQAVCSI